MSETNGYMDRLVDRLILYAQGTEASPFVRDLAMKFAEVRDARETRCASATSASGMRLLEFDRYEVSSAAPGYAGPAPMAQCLGPVTFDADEIVEIGRGVFHQRNQHYLATIRVRGDAMRVQVACSYETAIHRWKAAKMQGAAATDSVAPLPSGWEVDHATTSELMLHRNGYCEAVRDAERGWISPKRCGVFLAAFKCSPAAVAQMVDALWPAAAHPALERT